MSDIDVIREALVRPYREVKDPSFFALDELPEFEALKRMEQRESLLADAAEAVEAYRQTFPANPAHPNDAAVAATLDALLARFDTLNQKAAQ